MNEEPSVPPARSGAIIFFLSFFIFTIGLIGLQVLEQTA